jgi:phosphoglycolate phosphatase
MHPGGRLTTIYAEAIAAYRAERDSALKLYDGVRETLELLRERGCCLVGYTESMAFYTNFRLRKTGVDELLDVLYSPADHALPAKPEDLRKYPAEHYDLRRTVHRYTPHGELKPNPHILRTILADMRVRPNEALYVGDSKSKDVAMAQEVGVLDVWAAYGAVQHKVEYELLRRVSHWPDTAVEAEKRSLASDDIRPTVSLRTSFAELLGVADFQARNALT